MTFERDLALRGLLLDAVQQHIVGTERQEKLLLYNHEERSYCCKSTLCLSRVVPKGVAGMTG